MTTREQLEMVYDWAFGVAEQIVASGRQVSPVILTCRFINGKMRSGKIGIVRDMSTIEDKDAVAALIKDLAARPQIDVVCFLVESWYVGALKKSDITAEAVEQARQALGGLTPAQHPDRREAVMFSFYSKVYDCLAMCRIERPANRLVREPLELTHGHAQGRFLRDPLPEDDE